MATSTNVSAKPRPADSPRRSKLFTGAFPLALFAVLTFFPGGPNSRAATTGCPAAGCTVTIRAFAPAFPDANPGVGAGLGKGAALPNFNFVVNVDNTSLPHGATEADGSIVPYQDANGYAHTQSNTPVVAVGGCATLACDGSGDRNVVTLPTGRYLISIRAPDRKLWGMLITLPRDTASDGTMSADVVLTEASEAKPLPLGSNKIFVFNDSADTNGAPDPNEPGLQGFTIEMYEQTNSRVSVDYNGDPLCSNPLPGDPAPGSWPNCETDSDGFVQVDQLGPATYFTEAVPPAGPCNDNPDSQWFQTTTIDGGLPLQTPVEEGASGAGAPTALAADGGTPGPKGTINFFGFVCAPLDIANPGTAEITGTALDLESFAAGADLYGDAVENPLVSLSDVSTGETIYVGRGDANGNFDIQGVPAGTYNVAIWDEQLAYITKFITVIVADGDVIDLNTPDGNGNDGVGVPRWQGWLDGTVYKDTNGNGKRDAGEPVIPNTDVDQRWRDGSIRDATFTDTSGHYEYPTAEGGALNKWIINEQGFARFSSYPGPSVHDPLHPSIVQPSCAVLPPNLPASNCLPVDQGGGLLTNQLVQPGIRTTVDWGKRDYPANEPGQIVGVTYWATTRNEFHANLQAHEDYEPGVPDVTVYLEGLGPDNTPNTADDMLLNSYVTDHWQGPTSDQNPPQTCRLTDSTGADVTADFNPFISSLCMDQALPVVETKDGAFDGGYAFADYCPNGLDLNAPDPDNAPCWNAAHDANVATEPLVAGTYITHFIAPKDPADSRPCNTDAVDPNVSTAKGNIPGGGDGCLYRPVKEEDVNVDLGQHFGPAIPPPDCVGDDHLIDQSTLVTRSPYFGKPASHAPLCDKRLVVLQNQQNANADFNLMTNFTTDPNGTDPSDTRIGDVQVPGRVVGLSLNDLVFDTNPASAMFGNNAAAPGLPVGIYARYDKNPSHWRLFTTVTTSDIGSYEALLPSTETLNCPIPQGPCLGMYRFLVDDPGTPNHPNANYDPNFARGTDYIGEIWPGKTNVELDTPMIPIAVGSDCRTPSGDPELLQVSRPYVLATDTTGTSRRITIQGVGFGTTPGTITLADPRGVGASRTIGPVLNANPTVAAGGIVSWTDRQIVLQVPATAGSFPAGQKQLSITENGRSTANGMTIHVLGTGYNPPVVNVPAWNGTGNRHAIQNAVDSAAAGSLLVLSPGTYYENVVMWKPVKLQGLGVGGTFGAENLQATTPGDPRFSIPGSVIDGRFFGTNQADWNATVAAHANSGSPKYQGATTLADVMGGADVLVLAKTTGAYAISNGVTGVFSAARVDGVSLATGGGNPGAGGIQLQARADNTQITNALLSGNSGGYSGGIGVGRPDANSHNFNVRIQYDRVIGNGSPGTLAGFVEAGGIGLFGGSNAYQVANNLICSNHTGEPDSDGFGAGVGHYGRSLNGVITQNQILFNTSIEAGGGISVKQQVGTTAGTGRVDITRNIIQTNLSGNDGGGIFVDGALTTQINIENNMIDDNVASDMGGAIMLHDSTNVRIDDDTIANNVSVAAPVIGSASATPHSAGLAVDGNSAAFQATLGAGAPHYSRPNRLRENIFWQNEAFTMEIKQPQSALISQGFIDFEVSGSAAGDTLTPMYSDITNGKILLSDGSLVNVPTGQHNTSGDPSFVAPFTVVLSVGANLADPTFTLVSIQGLTPPDQGVLGDYHINLFGTNAQQLTQATASPVIDRGVSFAGTPAIDFDGQARPILDVPSRSSTPYDFGADERALTGP